MKAHLALCAVVLAIASTANAQIKPSDPVQGTMVTFRNELPSSYRLTRVRLVVDGAVRHDGGAFDVARLPAGPHIIEIITTYQMHDAVLSYVGGYGIEVRSAHVIRGSTWVDARAVHNGGATIPLDRSAVITWRDH